MLIFLSMLESDEERRLFTDLYNQYGNMMLHVAKRYFPKDMYAAEDVVQNAWIRVVDHFQKIQAVPSKKRGAYLVVIVRNEAITALRKQKPELQFDENFVEGYIDLENDNTRSIIDTIRAMPDRYPNNHLILHYKIVDFLEEPLDRVNTEKSWNLLYEKSLRIMLLCQIHISLNREL